MLKVAVVVLCHLLEYQGWQQSGDTDSLRHYLGHVPRIRWQNKVVPLSRCTQMQTCPWTQMEEPTT
jgi:hypothetical protein